MKQITLILTVFVIICSAFTALAQIPQIINYQGRLTDSGGNPVANGPYLANFKLYGSETGSDLLWSSGFQTITTTDGLFSYPLGSNATLPVDIFGPGSEPFLGITISTDPEIFPRTKITSTAFAWHSNSADTADFARDIADNSIHSGHIQDHSIIGNDIGYEEITGDNIDNGTILFEDIGTNGATEGDVMKMNEGGWIAAPDISGSGDGGDITSVLPTENGGLEGGGDEGDVELGIEDYGVASIKIATNAVTTVKIMNNAVTETKIATGAVTTNEIFNRTITNNDIANDAGILPSKLSQDGASTGDVIEWKGSYWSAGSGFPSGGIIMWSGTLASIPTGWVLCDGTNGTPNLTDRFVWGVGPAEDPGAVGGSTSHLHSVDPPNTQTNIPDGVQTGSRYTHDQTFALNNHTHDVDIPTFSSAPGGAVPPFYRMAFIMKQ